MTSLPPVHFQPLDEALANIGAVCGQPTDQKCPLQIVAISVHRVVGKGQAFPDLTRVPFLTVGGGKHPERSNRRLRTGCHTQVREIALGEQVETITLPVRKAIAAENPSVEEATAQPKTSPLLFAFKLGGQPRRQLDNGKPSRKGF